MISFSFYLLLLLLGIITRQLNNSRCHVGAVLLFLGQTWVTPDYDLKNVTISSDASYMHWGQKNKYLAAVDQHSSQACVLYKSENTISFWKMLTFIFE